MCCMTQSLFMRALSTTAVISSLEYSDLCTVDLCICGCPVHSTVAPIRKRKRRGISGATVSAGSTTFLLRHCHLYDLQDDIDRSL